MPKALYNLDIRKQALLLAEEARRTDPDISKFYWFPANDEVRLIEVTTKIPPSRDNQVQPFYFPPAPKQNMAAPSGVALILDGEDRKLSPPKGWGGWETAVELKPDEAA